MQLKSRQNIGEFWIVGINYKKTDASVRGLYAVGQEQYTKLLSIAPGYGISEFFILSTCNRTEIYGFANDAARLADLLCEGCEGNKDIFGHISYVKNAREAIEHLFRVGAGLDSQILGDYEILGQIKKAAKYAKEGGSVGPFMERLVNSVLQASKAVKTHTALSGGTVSVSFAAVQYIREFFEGPVATPQMKCPSSLHLMTQATIDHYIAPNNLSAHEKKIVLVGTGKIGKATCLNLIDYLGTHNITLVNRTEETAINLAKELGIQWAPVDNLQQELADADIILVSTSAPGPLVLAQHIAGTGAKLLIDLSVPCNVAADAQALPDVTFVDVDTLSKIKDETLSQRKAEVPKALSIINELIDDFMQWYDMRRHVPVLKEIKSKLKDIYIDPLLLNNLNIDGKEVKIQKVINSLAVRIRQENTPGCSYIQAINEYLS
jgi:glutamyl-tRNA reductase